MSTMRKLRRKRRSSHDIEPLAGLETTAPPKLSQLIIQYAEPLLESAGDDRECEAAISIAVACWNLSLMPEDAREPLLANGCRKLSGKPGFSAVRLEALIRWMIDRRLELFPHERRAVINYGLMDKGDAYSLVAVSSQPE